MARLIKKIDYDLNNNFYHIVNHDNLSLQKKYESSNYLKLWIDFAQDKPRLYNKNNKNLFANYIGDVSTRKLSLKNKAGTRIKNGIITNVNSASSVVSDYLDNMPTMSFSFWLLLDNTVSNTGKKTVVAKQNITNDNLHVQYDLLYDFTTNTFEFALNYYDDDVVTKSLILHSNEISNIFDGPFHVVLTYNLTETIDENKLSIYINGQYQTNTVINNNNFENLNNFQYPLLIGNGSKIDNDEIVHWDNNLDNAVISEFALWNKQLTESEVEAVYLGSCSSVYEETSGNLNVDVKTHFNNINNKSYAYPTKLDTRQSYFNDTDSYEFVSAYATASITFINNNPKLTHGSIIEITGFIDKDTNKTLKLKLLSLNTELDEEQDQNVSLIKLYNSMSTEDTANIISRVINNNNIGIESRVENSTIKLKQKVPKVGSYNQNNIIKVYDFIDRNLDNKLVVISQFDYFDESMIYPLVNHQYQLNPDTYVHTPNRLLGIEAPANLIKGVTDNRLEFDLITNKNKSSVYFDDNQIVDEENEFYRHGTTTSSLEGFSSRLSSKECIEIDINPQAESEVYFSTGSMSVDKHSGISYFDFNQRVWKPVGLENNLDFVNSDEQIATGSMLAIMPSTFWGNFPNLESVPLNLENMKHLGKPLSFAGFPMADKFDASETQCFNLRDILNGPFLVEKIEIEVSGTLGSYPAYSSEIQHQTVQDIKYSNISGVNKIGKLLEIEYVWTSDIVPIVILDSESYSDKLILEIRFKSGKVKAKDIIDVIKSKKELNAILHAEVVGDPNNFQII
jgi:hypothetical protein